MQIERGMHSVIRGDNNIICLQYSEEAFIFHEMAHVRQALEKGKMEFDGNYMKTPGTSIYESCRFEVEAHRIQYSINPSSLLKNVRNILDIDIEYLSKYTINGYFMFEYAIPVYEHLINIYKSMKFWDETRFYDCKEH